jgi:hypothetical protein
VSNAAQTRPVREEATLASALHSVGAELDELGQRIRRLAASAQSGERPVLIVCPGSCGHVERYRAAVREAVHVLERTRTSFKSKELGALRRTLESLLFDEAPR